MPDDFVLSDRNIAEVQQRLPNRNGMTRNARPVGRAAASPTWRNVACMKDCADEPELASSLPDFARAAHGNLAEQNRAWAPRAARTRPRDRLRAQRQGRRDADATWPGARLPRLPRRRQAASSGPAFDDVAARYKGEAGAEAQAAGEDPARRRRRVGADPDAAQSRPRRGRRPRPRPVDARGCALVGEASTDLLIGSVHSPTTM